MKKEPKKKSEGVVTMILGEISEIAVLYEIIEEWSDDTWKNGLFNIIIDNKYVMKEIIASTINSELN
nr:immunity 42 family protein [Lachnospiraceae bacterium]